VKPANASSVVGHSCPRINWLVELVGLAEPAVRQPPEEQPVLDHQRPVQAEFVPGLVDHGVAGRHRPAEHYARRIPRNQVQREEGDTGRAEHHQDGQYQAAHQPVGQAHFAPSQAS
jgi:hypothetical protein